MLTNGNVLSYCLATRITRIHGDCFNDKGMLKSTKDAMSAFVDKSEHQTITAAGWIYRLNDRGWVIYRDPKTGTWYTRHDAIAILLGSARHEAAVNLPN